MKININTKYNIGDTIYIAWCYYGEYIPECKPYTIKDVYASVINEDIKISYSIIEETDDIIMEIPESFCFPTYAECTKWCEKQNKIS